MVMGCWWIDGGLPILERPAEAAAARERPGSARNEIEALLGREWIGEDWDGRRIFCI